MTIERDMIIRNEMAENDRIRLTTMIPEDVWLMIFELSNAETLKRLYDASPYFRNLLLSRRTTFLFAKVWRILMCKYGLARSRNNRQGNIPRKQTYCIACNSKKPNTNLELLPIRHVCKEWCQAFDNWCTVPCSHSVAENDRNIAEMLPDGDTANNVLIYCLKLEEHNIARLKSHFAATHTNVIGSRSPFFGNSLRVVYEGSYQYAGLRGFSEEVADLFSKYGHHVQKLSLQENVNLNYRQGYAQLRHMLAAASQLELLDVTHNLTTSFRHACITGEFLRKIREHITANPIPRLERLHSIKLGGNGSLLCILHELLQRNYHISSLSISQLSIAEHDILTTPLPNLTELSLVFYTIADLEALEDSRLSWPLTKLKLDFGVGKECVFREAVNWLRLCSVVRGKWSDTLTELELTLPRLKTADESTFIGNSTARLQLNCLERVKLKCYSYNSLDFMLPLEQTLKYLSIVDSVQFKQRVKKHEILAEGGSTIKFWSCEKKTLETNLWAKFPKLGRVYFQSGFTKSSHSRGEWVVWMENRKQILKINESTRCCIPCRFI